ncbi:NAD/FAD-binding protein [Rubrivivax gelatinosus]|uniref:NAD/FAD-binding protein n=1 Tax=Rubrivivax gelatinosus TaxID=28068 RepID=A0ABS1DYB3_RUBGE|nr:FAD-dependent oxidoreductase [Rubrivivax gelatinosus]MBK1612835.1 NAD/FAD-binding protein [Rubrivivax gelatinosus]MBK1714463.1 NAD/FAD-binding protein [Rubrivivax gelatinosus]
MRRVAVVGSGISGLAAAYELSCDARVTLFEAGSYFGGHTNTIDLTIDGVTHGVDTGFLVFNHRTYPNLLRLFAELGVETAPSDMSFSVQAREDGLEWSGSDLNSVFAQRRNLLRPRFLKMLSEIVRFNRLATAIAEAGAEDALAEPIGEFLGRHGFGETFRDWYFLPMIGCIWSCPTDQMLRFPVATMIRFCHNHGLIQVNDRPQWHTVKGGARHYVEKMLPRIADARISSPVLAIHRDVQGPSVVSAAGTERFDEVVLACHSDQALALLADPSEDERAVLGAIRYQPNRAVVHSDASVLPRRKLAWASWNYVRSAQRDREQAAVCLHYLLNRLQPLPWQTPVIVSLNPETEPAAASVFREIEYAHPVFDLGAIEAQRRVPALQGQAHTWYCGAWTRYGFHEDGLASGLDVVRRVRECWQSGAPARVAA